MQAWGRFEVLERLTGGHRNICFKLVRENRYFVAKTSRRSELALAWLGVVQNYAQRAGFRVPALIKSLSGNYLENGWTLEPFLQGRAASQSEIRRFEPLLLKFHQLGKNHIQRPTFFSAKDLLSQKVSGGINLDDMPLEIVKKCRDAWEKLPDVAPCTIHGDFSSGNILVSDGQMPALIDWDECRVDAPVFDLEADKGAMIFQAKLAWEIACCWQVEPTRAKALAAKL